jgi:hypothetical protein
MNINMKKPYGLNIVFASAICAGGATGHLVSLLKDASLPGFPGHLRAPRIAQALDRLNSKFSHPAFHQGRPIC